MFRFLGGDMDRGPALEGTEDKGKPEGGRGKV